MVFLDGHLNIRPIISHRYTIWIARCAFVFIAFVSSASNVNIAYLDLLRMPEYQRRVYGRIAAMQQAAKQDTIAELRPLFSPEEGYMVPQTLYTLEFNKDDARAFGKYYGADSVVVSSCYVQQ
ncbi:hypothetical protein MUN84_16405 [Hymenobacter sp. 5516J-16]|uniref:hypothetical protein n=1 Tax=Hymenobacter sp. 5516J-16 TaxID=2932253 RepID=UPI001FD2DBD4|nr:hypothetical protein [Hymenobacter sp. 5516J-16]UOQ76162.1 hypothetical protein MUN84_16405 [Hymenobacter sp. 5516J-16]